MSVRPMPSLLRAPWALFLVSALASALLLACSGDGGRRRTTQVAGPASTAESTTAGNCADGVDNDGDGRTDAADPNCGVESRAGGNCSDGVDNDGDGAIDAADPNCGVESLAAGNCADGIDNDGDGRTDAADTQCRPETTAAGTCSDGFDNDGDGAIDAADTGCPPPCSAEFAGDDGTACYRDPAVQVGSQCNTPFRLFLFFSIESGAFTIDVEGDRTPGNGGDEPGVLHQECHATCVDDPLTFSCTVTDSDGNLRTVTGTLDPGSRRIDGTITTGCGETVDYRA